MARRPPRIGGLAAADQGVGTAFVSIGLAEDDAPDFSRRVVGAAPQHGHGLMLGLAHTLVAEGLHDIGFLERYCVGFDRFLPYLLGTTDGRPKDAGWAATITGLDAEAIRKLARRMAAQHTMITVSWSLPARRPWRAALLDGDDAGSDARPNRSTRKRDRLRLCLRERDGNAAGMDRGALGALGREPDAKLDPGSAHLRYAAVARRLLSLSRPGTAIP